MNKEYHRKLVEVVGSSFYYFTHMKEINLTCRTQEDFEKLTTAWIKEYSGGRDLSGAIVPLEFNLFKPAVDQLVNAIFSATENEIERRLNERWSQATQKQ